jgi:hypothetical protein
MANASRYRRFRPQLEALDGRDVPSVTVVESTGTTGTVVKVYGDQWANTIQVTDDGTAGEGAITITVSDDSDVTPDQEYTFDGSVTRVVVCSASGADTVSYELTGDLQADVSRTVVAWLGNQEDTFDAQLGGLAADSTLKLYVFGGNFGDTLSVTANGAVAGTLDVRLFGQNGTDSVSAEVTGAVSGELNLLIHGGNGMDVLSALVTVDAASDPEDPNAPPPAAGNLTVKVCGGNGKDNLTLLVDGAGAGDVSAESKFLIYGGLGWDTFNFTPDLVTAFDREAKLA